MAAVTCYKRASWTSQYIKDSFTHQAICSDGTTPIYFKSISSESKKWLFYLRGGAGCSNEAMCLDRLRNHQYFTSSTDFTGTFNNSNGIFDR